MRKVSNPSEFHPARLKTLNRDFVKSPSMTFWLAKSGLLCNGSVDAISPGAGLGVRYANLQYHKMRIRFYPGSAFCFVSKKRSMTMALRSAAVRTRVLGPSVRSKQVGLARLNASSTARGNGLPA
jgi:hypothetical protein